MIGFFDSGLGGLTILKAVRALMPEYDYVYFGDTAHLPFGDKTEEEIFELTRAGILKLFQKGALLVVVACNTASAESLRKLQDSILIGEYSDRRLLGVIIPTIEALLEQRAKNALLIGTERTIDSHKYERELAKITSDVKLTARATPKLVPCIESGNMDAAKIALEEAIGDMAAEVDTLILGCTHYTVLKGFIRSKYPWKVLSQDEIIPQKLKDYLERHPEISMRLTQGRKAEILLSEESEQYTALKKEFMHV
jgi:glutamate racemase